MNGDCEERPHTSRDPAVVASSQVEAHIFELKSCIIFNTQKIFERRKIIEHLRTEQQDLLSRLAEFETIALKTMEKLSQAESFILIREERLRQNQLSESKQLSQGTGSQSTGLVADIGRCKMNRPAGFANA